MNGQQHYEFELRRADSTLAGHTYYQPFIRDDYWVRLLSLQPGSPSLVNTVTGPNHSAAVVVRYREWWTTNPSGIKDVLEISTRSDAGNQPPVNALHNVQSDGIGIATSAIGVHVHDNPADQVSSLNLIPFFVSQAFQTGVDVFMPATHPASGTITFRVTPRGDATRQQVLRSANWPSSDHRILMYFNDYVQDINTWGECKRAHPSPCE